MDKLKSIIPPFLMSVLRTIRTKVDNFFFQGSKGYWEKRYSSGDTSGEGSYGELAGFKAKILNDFVNEQQINSVIEFGCGDGNQLSLAKYPKYIGLDVSKTAISMCQKRFLHDRTKQFYLYEPDKFLGTKMSADLGMSLDVIYHLIENNIYDQYIEHLFSSSKRFVVIYSPNVEEKQVRWVRLRKFTDKVTQCAPNWELIQVIKNQYPDKSIADFYFYRKNPQ